MSTENESRQEGAANEENQNVSRDGGYKSYNRDSNYNRYNNDGDSVLTVSYEQLIIDEGVATVLTVLL